MTIDIYCSNACEQELRYICDLVFKDTFGLAYALHFGPSDQFEIHLGDKKVSLPNVFFPKAAAGWLTAASLPMEPLSRLEAAREPFADRLVESSLPVLYGKPHIEISEKEAVIGIDILGSCFYMLSLYGEALIEERDPKFLRVPYNKTLTFREGLMGRPLANEYMELLWFVLQSLQPGLSRKPRRFSVQVTQDVDDAFFNDTAPFGKLLRNCAGDVVKRGSLLLGVKRLASYVLPGQAGHRLDPNNTFEFFMTELEKRNLRGEFYFVPALTAEIRQKHGDIQSPPFQSLIKEILDRGHQVGIHPGFGTFNNLDRLRAEVEFLESTVQAVRPSYKVAGGRHHGLQWDPRITWGLWDKLGLKFDSTSYFAEQPGFRSGCCYAYRTYDVTERKPLNLVERPLISMDATYINYLKSSDEETVRKTVELAGICKKYNGDFVCLWHNCKLGGRNIRRSFISILDALSG